MVTENVKMLSLQRDGECVCGAVVPRGVQAGWHRSLRLVLCARCLTKQPDAPLGEKIGVAGDPRNWEYARCTTGAVRVGATGGQAATELTHAAGGEVLFLYNRRWSTGRERGDIEMLAIAPSGVHIIAPKKYDGRKIRADRRGEILMIDRRRDPAASAGMRRQLAVVTAAVRTGPRPLTPVHAAYCFIGAKLPWTALSVDGVPAINLRGVEKRLREPGPLDAEARAMLHSDLALRFPRT